MRRFGVCRCVVWLSAMRLFGKRRGEDVRKTGATRDERAGETERTRGSGERRLVLLRLGEEGVPRSRGDEARDADAPRR